MPGIFTYFKRLLPGHKPLVTYQIVEVEKGVLVPGAGDDEAIASLKNHPGMIALLNRMRLQGSILQSKLQTRQKDIRDVDILVIGLSWLRFVESEIGTATGNLRNKEVPRIATNEVEDFEKIRSAIQSIGNTNPE